MGKYGNGIEVSDGNGNEVIEMGGNWYENSVPAHLYPQSGASRGQNMWGGRHGERGVQAYNGGLEAE